MSVIVRKFKASDLDAFEPIEPDLEGTPGQTGIAVTGVRDGKIVGCGGVDDTGEVWLRLSDTCRKFPLDTLRWLKSAIELIEETCGFEQLNATVKDCFGKGVKLVEYLGFVRTQEIDQWFIYSKRTRACS